MLTDKIIKAVHEDIPNINSQLEQIQNKYVINLKKFGAIGDGVTDDTQAFKNALFYAKDLIRQNYMLVDGVTIKIDGGKYKISETIVIDCSGIIFEGESLASSCIYAPTFNDVVFKFQKSDGTSIYRCGVRNLTINTRKSSNETSTHILMTKPVHCTLENLNLYSWYNGIVIKNGGKVFINKCILGQDQNSELWGCGLDLDGSDIHVSDTQVIPNKTNGTNSVILRNIDGIYFNNTHQHGGLIIYPEATSSCITAFFNNHYIDTSSGDMLTINVTADDNVKEIKFNNSLIRDGGNGVVFNTTYKNGSIEFNNTTFKQLNRAFNLKTANTVTINSCTFDRITVDDILVNSNNNIITNNRFISSNTTKAEGNINLVGSCTGNIVTGNNFVDSNSSVKIRGNVRGNIIRGNMGYSLIRKGVVTLDSSLFYKQVTVDFPIDLNESDIQLTSCSGTSTLYFNNVSGKNFQINSGNAGAKVAWYVNAEN